MQKRAKKEFFGHIIDIGWFCPADIAYSDEWKWYLSNKANQDAGNAH